MMHHNTLHHSIHIIIFYETGDRLVYSSEQDYLDWYMRLEQFSENIKNSIDNNKKCLNEGFTQPKIMTNGVIAQIDGILNVSIEDTHTTKYSQI